MPSDHSNIRPRSRIFCLSEKIDITSEIPGLSNLDVCWVEPEGVRDVIKSLDQHPRDVRPGFIIDCSHLSGTLNFFLDLQNIPTILKCRNQVNRWIDAPKPTGCPEDLSGLFPRLGLAAALSERNWTCIVIVDDTPPADDQKGLLRPDGTPMFHFRFLRSSGNHPAIIEALDRLNSLQCIEGNSFTVTRPLNSHHYLIPDAITLLEQWEAEEFELDQVLAKIHSICDSRRVAAVVHAPGKISAKTILKMDIDREEVERQAASSRANVRRSVFLRCATLARLMATRFFERRTSDVIVKIKSASQLDSATFTTAIQGRKLFEFEQSHPTWFHFGDRYLLDGGVELSLSRRSLLVVDFDSGRADSVVDMLSPEYSSLSRYELLTRITKLDMTSSRGDGNSGCAVISALADGFVEVYHCGEMVLWYDRFRWRLQPFSTLVRKLEQYCKNGTDFVDRMVAAIAMLMDRKESSIIAFVGKNEISNLSRKQMRAEVKVHEPFAGEESVSTEVRVNFVNREIGAMSADGIAAILRMDGAHIVVDGRFEEIALHVSTSSDAMTEGRGTGRRAAEELSKVIKAPSFIVKVSSSGELRIYRGY